MQQEQGPASTRAVSIKFMNFSRELISLVWQHQCFSTWQKDKFSTIENDSELQTQLRNTKMTFTQNTEFRDGLKEENSRLRCGWVSSSTSSFGSKWGKPIFPPSKSQHTASTHALSLLPCLKRESQYGGKALLGISSQFY